MLEVASSRQRMSYSWRATLRKLIICFSPFDRFFPPSSTSIYKSTTSLSPSTPFPLTTKPVSRTTSIILLSLSPSSGSMFSFKLPLNRNPNYGIIFICLLKSYNEISYIYFPFTIIFPPYISYNLNKIFKIELFPEPVLPIIAIFSPFFISRFKSFRANVFPLS